MTALVESVDDSFDSLMYWTGVVQTISGRVPILYQGLFSDFSGNLIRRPADLSLNPLTLISYTKLAVLINEKRFKKRIPAGLESEN